MFLPQPRAPFHVVPRGWAGPSFLAMLLFEKYGQHQPLNRQADRFAREGVQLSTSTLADLVGVAAFALIPVYRLIDAQVLAAERLYGDDTTVPVMAKSKTDTARLWVYLRDDRPFAGSDPQRHFSTIRRTGVASIHVPTSPLGRDCCRPMLMAVITSCTRLGVYRGLSSRLVGSRTLAASSSSSPMWRVLPARRAAANVPARLTQSHSKPCRSSIPCSTSTFMMWGNMLGSLQIRTKIALQINMIV